MSVPRIIPTNNFMQNERKKLYTVLLPQTSARLKMNVF